MKKFKLVKDKGYFQSLRETKSVKELDDGAVEISGYASTKDKDRGGDVVEPKAFASALERYMTNPIVLLQHKADKPIGVVESADIDDNGLYIKAKISQNTDGVVDLIKNGVLRAFSIGYSVKDYETDVRELADGSYDMTNIIKDLELYEISVVSIPMNPYALSKSVEDLLEVEESEEESSKENVVDLGAEENEAEMHIESESKEESDDEVQESEKNDDENAVVIEDENQESEEKSDEGTNIQSEEKNAEIESEAKEESEEEGKVIEGEIEQGEEEIVEEESIEQKSEEIAQSEDEGAKDEQNEADENSEIDEESVEEDSENADETPADEDQVVETHDEEIVETKSIETESQKQFDFDSKIAQLSKSFDEKLAEKDEKIKSLESKVETMTKLFAESLETIDEMTTAVKNTPVNAGLQYKRPLKKGGYYDIASIIKNL